jgi:TatD DNase family protein
VPLDRILSETDAPYVTPASHRGKRNESAYIPEIVRAIARIRGQEEALVEAQILENAQRFFGLR